MSTVRLLECVVCHRVFEHTKRGRPPEVCSPACKAERKRAYRDEHRDEIAERQRAYRDEHRDEIAERQRAYRDEHRDEIAERQRAYYDEHRDEIAERQRAYRDEHRDTSPIEKDCTSCGAPFTQPRRPGRPFALCPTCRSQS
jgi:hypothetical protein